MHDNAKKGITVKVAAELHAEVSEYVRSHGSKDIVKAKLYEAIAQKYGDLNTQKYESKRLRDVFRNQKPFAEFPIELFNQTVISISFDDHENIVLIQTIK